VLVGVSDAAVVLLADRIVRRVRVRVAAQIYNSEDQYDRLASALPALLAEQR